MRWAGWTSAHTALHGRCNLSNSYLPYVLAWSLGGAILCGLLARAKNRGGVGGFIMGLLFGIFAVVYYAFVPSKSATAAGSVKPCPQCAESIGMAAQVCPHCGFRFAAQTLERPEGVPVWPGVGNKAVAWCDHCAKPQMHRHDGVCVKCGNVNEVMRYYWGYHNDPPEGELYQ